MASFGRTVRQNIIWVRLNAIRAIVDEGLYGPDDGGYTGDDGELETEHAALLVEYAGIHTANGTKG